MLQLKNKLTLVSASPARKQILQQLGLNPVILPSSVVEHSDATEHEDYVSQIALQKLQSVLPQLKTPYALSADTIVCVDSLRLGKPRDAADAKEMITCLQGRMHRIYSGICFYAVQNKTILQAVDSAELRFSRLRTAEIDRYIAQNSWQGAAGAYKLQDDALVLIESLHGAPSTVLGLPVHTLAAILDRYIRTNKISHL